MDIDVKRVINRLEAIYACGKKADGTCDRVAFSPEDVAGRTLFMEYFSQLGLIPRVDEAGNIIVRLAGKNPELPAILLGSHLDTVPEGGKYDGVLGCVAGLEVCETLIRAQKELNHPLEVIVFTDEEGFRFGNGLLGSSAFCGIDTGIRAADIDMYGQKRAEVMESYGITADSTVKAKRQPESVHCFLELHVEQGASLYKNHIPVGVVSVIAGVSRYEIHIKGQANHSGSTMMCDRKDALAAAARFIASVPEITAEYGKEYTVATVGTIKVLPNSVNVIPSDCIFNLEIRDQSEKIMRLIESKLKERLEEVTKQFTDDVLFRQISYHAPAPMSTWVTKIIESAVQELETKYSVMPSGAFHDSLVMSPVFPTGMIFIPSVDGISHSPYEASLEEDIATGCSVLLHSVLAADMA